MSGLTLTRKSPLTGNPTSALDRPCVARIDLSGIVPDQLLTRDVASIAHMTVQVDNRPVELSQLFDIEEGDRQSLILRGDLSNVDRVAGGMRDGLLVLESSIGQRVADGMRGGQVVVKGNVGDYACSNLSGGSVIVHGSAGDYLASATSGTRRGMRGGSCFIYGNAGQHVAYRMRRGTLVVTGSVDTACASSMVAGSLVLFGDVAQPLGVGMRRGSVLVVAAEQPRLPVGFTPFEPIQLSYLPLLIKALCDSLPAPLHERLTSKRVQRALGDRASGGMGEVLWIGGEVELEGSA